MIIVDTKFSAEFNTKSENLLENLAYKYDVDYYTYMIIIDNAFYAGYMSNLVWQKSYMDEHMHLDCPLFRHSAANKNNYMYMEWDKITPINKSEKIILEARRDFNISRGMTFRFSHTFDNKKIYEIIALSSSSANYFFEQKIRILNNEIMSDFSELRNKGLNEVFLSLASEQIQVA